MQSNDISGQLRRALPSVARWSAIALGALFGLLILALIAVQVPFVQQRVLSSSLNAGLESYEFRATVSEVGGVWPWHVRVGELRLEDANGEFATLQDVEIDLRVLPLLGRHVHITRAAVGSGTYARQPILPPREPKPFRLPTLPDEVRLPFALTLDVLEVGPIVSSAGEAELAIEGGGMLQLNRRTFVGDLSFSGGAAGDAQLRFAFDPAARQADLLFELIDRDGQWFVPLTPLAPGTPVDLNMSLSGQPDALVLVGAMRWGSAIIDWSGTGAWGRDFSTRLDVHVAGVGGDGVTDLLGYSQTGVIEFLLQQGGGIELARLDLQSETFAANLQGQISDELDLTGNVTLIDAPLWAGRLGLDNLSGADAALRIIGPRDAPHVTVEARAENFGAGGIQTSALNLGANAAVLQRGRVLDADLRVVTEPLIGERLPAGLNNAVVGLSTSVRFNLDENALNVSNLEGVWGWLALAGEGTIDADSPMRFAAMLDIDDLSQVSPDMSGRAMLQFEARRRRGSDQLDVTGRGTTENLVTVGRWAQVLGDAPDAEFTLNTAGDLIELQSLALNLAAGELQLAGQADRANASAALEGQFSVHDLGALASQLSGAMDGEFTFEGTRDNPIVVVTARAPQLGMGEAVLEGMSLNARYLVDRGNVSLTGQSGSDAVRVAFPFTRDGSDILGQLDARFATLQVTGPAGMAAGAPTADLAFAAEDIAPLAQFVRQAGGASDDLRVHGQLEGSAQFLDGIGTVQATMLGARLEGISAPSRANEIGLQATYIVASRTVEAATLNAVNPRFGPSRFSTVEASASGPLDGLEALLSLRGPADGPFSLDVAARRSERGAGSDIVITAVDGRSLDFVVALNEPARFDLGPEGVELSRTSFTILNEATGRQGALTAEAQLWAGAPYVHLQADSLPAGALAVFGLPVDWTGILAGEVTLNARAGNNPLHVALQATDLTNDPDVPPLDVVLNADATGTDLTGVLQITDRATGAALVDAQAQVPLRWAAGQLSPNVNWDAVLSGSAHIDAPLNRLWLFVPVDTVAVAGHLQSDVAIRGTLGTPVASGMATLSDGSLEHFQTGFLLADANGTFNFTEGGDVAIDMRATDGNGGRARLEATAHLPRDEHWAIDGRLRLFELAVARRDELRAKASGDLRLTGTLEDALLEGTVTMDRIDAQIPNQLPPSVVDLPVTRVDANGEEVADGKSSGTQRQLQLPLSFDVTLEVPRQAFVRGRGLDSEWGGSLAITGTMDEPRIRGSLNVLRGTFDFSRSRFTLSEGRIEFRGGDRIDPSIALRAEAPGPDFTSIVRATGRARAPTITISSDPVMPEDTVMAQILFGKRPEELTALELVQIAEASATLTGRGGGGVLSGARRALGVDFLSVDTGTTASGERDVSVSVGQYIAPNVFVGTRRGTEPGSGAVTVEMEVTPNITVDAEVRQDSQGSAGVDWRWDY